MRFLYSALLYVIAPFALARLVWRSRREPGYRARLGERFGFLPSTDTQPVWLHAVSVGEVMAAVPLVDALLEKHPGIPVVVSTSTPSGAAVLRSHYGERVRHVYMPFDLPDAVRRAFRRLAPRAMVILETELWPNLVALAPCPVLLFNARLSEKSFHSYQRVELLAAPMLRGFLHIACQSESDAKRFIALGALAETTSVCGNLKAEHGAMADNAQLSVGDRRPVIVAGSTHEGEENALLEAYSVLREQYPQLLLVLAPRHVTRSEAVARQCEEAGLRVANPGSDVGQGDVLVVNTIGDLAGYYACADIAFVGGSLVERGGHNLLEPAVQGVPMLAGPSLYNVAADATSLLAAGGMRTIASATALEKVLGELLADDAAREAMGRAAKEAAESGRGALAHCLKRLQAVLN